MSVPFARVGDDLLARRRGQAARVYTLFLVAVQDGLVDATSRDFFGSERRTNTTRWTPGPAIPAVAPKQGANRDDHSEQHGLNRPRHDE